MVISSFPVASMDIALGYAFSQAFESKIAGFTYGLVLISIGIMLGSIVAFLISRYWISRVVRKACMRNPTTFTGINTVISKEGWKAIFLMRLTPLPFSIMSYLLGLSTVKLRDYLIGGIA